MVTETIKLENQKLQGSFLEMSLPSYFSRVRNATLSLNLLERKTYEQRLLELCDYAVHYDVKFRTAFQGSSKMTLSLTKSWTIDEIVRGVHHHVMKNVVFREDIGFVMPSEAPSITKIQRDDKWSMMISIPPYCAIRTLDPYRHFFQALGFRDVEGTEDSGFGLTNVTHEVKKFYSLHAWGKQEKILVEDLKTMSELDNLNLTGQCIFLWSYDVLAQSPVFTVHIPRNHLLSVIHEDWMKKLIDPFQQWLYKKFFWVEHVFEIENDGSQIRCRLSSDLIRSCLASDVS